VTEYRTKLEAIFAPETSADTRISARETEENSSFDGKEKGDDFARENARIRDYERDEEKEERKGLAAFLNRRCVRGQNDLVSIISRQERVQLVQSRESRVQIFGYLKVTCQLKATSSPLELLWS